MSVRPTRVRVLSYLVGLLLALGLQSNGTWGLRQAAAQLNGGGAGVVIDASGVLRMQAVADADGKLLNERIRQARVTLNPAVVQTSALRKISLSRLERAIKAQRNNDRPPTAEMNYLAGLTRIQYVFCYPDSGDVVIAGPAEGWVDDVTGRTVGMQTGAPVVQLQDLAAAMRVFAPGQKGGAVVGCSIDPTQEGLVRMQEFLQRLGSYATPNDTQYIVDGLRTNLGLQTVRIMGVAPDTHFAQVLVEADYRMKLIAVGLEPPQVKMTTFIDRATAAVARNALIRWYFIPDYHCLRTTADGLGLELAGHGVKLVDENEVVLSDGRRTGAAPGLKNGASTAFTTSFTQKYGELSARKPVYAELRNLIDLTMAAAFMQREDYYGKAGWDASLLLDEAQLPIQNRPAPLQVDTVVTSVWKGNQLLTPVAGGVTIEARRALAEENRLADEGGRAAAARDKVTLEGLRPNQWWWD